MKPLFQCYLFIVGCLIAACQSANQQKFVPHHLGEQNQSIPYKDSFIPYRNFRLTYSTSGLGSGFGSMNEVFRETGIRYVYTFEQTSYYTGDKIKKPDTLCMGDLSYWAIDSIIELIKPLNDNKIYRTNPRVMSGDIHYMNISSDSANVSFTLHNAYDTTVRKVIVILNRFIPNGRPQLWMTDIPENLSSK